MINEIKKQFANLNFEQVDKDCNKYNIDRTLSKGKFLVVHLLNIKEKTGEILLYKDTDIQEIKNIKEQSHNFLASFIDNDDGWELAEFCCKELYTREQHKIASLKNIYTNGIMLSPNGEIMCRCGKDRI